MDKKLNILTEIINEWDPANLFPDAPENEYGSEISSIIEILYNVNTPTELAREIQSIFNKAFSWDFNEDHFIIISNKIWSQMK
ncbi:DUF1871 family protein [Chengkuizengella axinellae]|uniref:DUF1871 family protein n=1 Tax=Chengkuizengella axinellae TaxID=3064388 RepID=A0ABT9J3F1_9BACL|nr:DUF1871 family protein [Chengkuizengella sp. 2205SS18-9]MDP5276093.1 DUF1871 family protein [Chengkuizengella sp. 2205SS18-9]